MKEIIREALRFFGLAVACGLIIWHVFSWHTAGKYNEMFEWLAGDKAYLTVLYNVGLMLVFGMLVGPLIMKITELALRLGKK